MATVWADDSASNAPPPAASGQAVVVTARKWAEPAANVPGSVTVLGRRQLEAAGIHTPAAAAREVPNLTQSEFSNRRLAFPFVRGIGSGRNSPAVTTLIDGVPQLSQSTANQELLFPDRIEYLRGPQGALYGRNTLGGAVNVVPHLPGDTPEAAASVTAGDFRLFDVRGLAGGPLPRQPLAVGAAAGYASRDGYSRNDLTGHTLGDQSAVFGRADLQLTGTGDWEVRLGVNAERDRDGDFALSDLATLKANPHHVMHDFEGESARDLVQPVLTATRRGTLADLTSITAFQSWRTEEQTDLDMSPLDLLRRDNEESQDAWIQEFRLATPAAAAPGLRWMGGLFLFASDYRQDVANEYRPAAVPLLALPAPFTQRDEAELNNRGVSLYGQASYPVLPPLELTLGLREDYEYRRADLSTGTDLMPGAARTEDDGTFSRLTPSLSAAWRFNPALLAYATLATGYKTGGFNTQTPAGQTGFDDETSLNIETGLKSAWLDNRLGARAAIFQTTWTDLQLDVPAATPSQFYIDNAGDAVSRGGEVELTARPLGGLELFGSVGVLDTEFDSGSQSGGVPVDGNELPFAPHFTWRAGAEIAEPLHGATIGFVRTEARGTSRYAYDAVNGAFEDAFTVVDARVGVRHLDWRIEGWVNNLFDQDTVPVAFASPLAPSGYVGENGAPRTLGVSLTRLF
jgi:iron complex outermembrane receptor protein